MGKGLGDSGVWDCTQGKMEKRMKKEWIKGWKCLCNTACTSGVPGTCKYPTLPGRIPAQHFPALTGE